MLIPYNFRCPLSKIRWSVAAIGLLILSLNAADAVEISGFTEPNRSVNVASPEQGIVTDVLVRVGESVQKGEPIATLDDEIHTILLESVRQRKDARGKLESTEAEVRMRTTRLEKLRDLRRQGFGRREEVQRATMDLEIAEAELKGVREDLLEQHWQFKKIEAELRRRVVRAPLDGVVAVRLKEPGEYVAPNEPDLITLVELQPLLAKFPMKRSLARRLAVGQSVNVQFESGNLVQGVVDMISPVVDAQSGTIKVKVRIDNRNGALLSGERCMINIPIGDEPYPNQPNVDPPNSDDQPASKVAVSR